MGLTLGLAALPGASGQRYVLPAEAFFDVDDGLIGRVTLYRNLADRLRRIGG